MRKRTQIALAAAVAAAVAGGTALTATAGESGAQGPTPTKATKTTVREDFNGDGYEDLAIGAPGNGTSSESPGYVVVVYGSADGLDPSTRTVIDQDTAGVPDVAEPGDRFGAQLVAADLDGDGVTDLAVTSPGESPENERGTGSVTVLWGDREQGLTGAGATLLAPGDSGYLVGRNLTVGDFNGDGAADLLLNRGMRGGHSVLFGPFDRDGTWAEEQVIDLNEDEDLVSVTAGDLDGDGRDDLVAFRGFEEMARTAVYYRGTDSGLTRDRTLTDLKGANGAVGDFDGDGYGDLAVRTVPGGVLEDLPYDHGTVQIIYGGEDGPSTRTATFTQNTAGVPGVNEDGDQFGATLTAGDVNGDGLDDLLVGVPEEDIDDRVDAGAAVQLLGSPKGLTTEGATNLDLDTEGVPAEAAAGDRFALALRLLDFDGDGRADLASGVPGRNGGTGALAVLPGSDAGLVGTGATVLTPADLDAPTTDAAFGRSLTSSTDSLF